MDQTARLKLPLIMAAQARKDVTHNEALAIADALVHLAVASRGAAEGVRYLVAAAQAVSGPATTARLPVSTAVPGASIHRRKAGAAGWRTRHCCWYMPRAHGGH